MFDYYEVMDEKKVKLVAICLKGRASTWWKQLQISHQRSGKVKIKNWEKMKKNLREQFLPFFFFFFFFISYKDVYSKNYLMHNGITHIKDYKKRRKNKEKTNYKREN